ncbi:hypothetical protein B0H12DRAFT_1126943 [Mycena haematopus]|nr:hypothetical protein B0H12DRAFT_1126943 [Mycena haematopus]
MSKPTTAGRPSLRGGTGGEGGWGAKLGGRGGIGEDALDFSTLEGGTGGNGGASEEQGGIGGVGKAISFDYGPTPALGKDSPRSPSSYMEPPVHSPLLAVTRMDVSAHSLVRGQGWCWGAGKIDGGAGGIGEGVNLNVNRADEMVVHMSGTPSPPHASPDNNRTVALPPARIDKPITRVPTPPSSSVFLGPTGSVAIANNMHIHSSVLNGLPELTAIATNTSLRSCCPETRSETLTAIISQLSSSAERPITVWLFGIAGSGKSTIAMSIAEDSKIKLGAFASLTRNATGTAYPRSILHTIVLKLAESNPKIFNAVRRTLDSERGIANNTDIHEQFEKLLHAPLRLAAPHSKARFLIILDALDECLDYRSRQALISLIQNDFPRLPAYFSFLITSRPTWDIVASFQDNLQIYKFPLETRSNRDMDGIFRYIEHCLVQSSPPCRLRDLESSIQSLSIGAGGLYFWAAATCGLVRQAHDPDRMLRDVLANGIHTMPSLETLYTTALEETGLWDSHNILATIVLTLDALLALNQGQSAAVLSRLGAVVQWTKGEFRGYIHPFRAYLFRQLALSNLYGKSGHPRFVDYVQGNQHLALGCLSVLTSQLRFNICKLESSYHLNSEVGDLQIRINAEVSAELAYAAKFCMKHLKAIERQQSTTALFSASSKFFPDCFLHWLEINSLFCRISSTRMELDILKRFVPENMHRLINDAQRFIDDFAPVIAASVPHIYLSAVPLSAEQGFVDTHFVLKLQKVVQLRTKPSIPSIQPKSQDGSENANCLAFSPDGSRMVTGSNDGTIQIWNTSTGREAGTQDMEQDDRVVSVAFFLGCKGVIWIWGVATREAVRVAALRGSSSDPIFCIAFSPDGRKIAASSTAGIQICTQKRKQEAILKHPDWVLSIAFSQDGSQIVSGSQDKLVRLWEGDRIIALLHGHDGPVASVSFSRDGKIVSGAQDRTIRIWEAKTGKLLFELFEHEDAVSAVAFSGDGRRILSWANDKTRRIWDAITGAGLGVCALSSTILSAIFSPGGEHVFLGSKSRIWKLSTTELLHDEGLPLLLNTSQSETDEYAGESTSQPDLTTIDEHGWVWNSNYQRMCWIPRHLREGFCDPSGRTTPSIRTLDLTNFVHGTDWIKCWKEADTQGKSGDIM